MKSDFPQEIKEALNNLNAAEKKVVSGSGIKFYAETLDALNEYVGEYPEYKEYISNVTTAHIRRIIDILHDNKPEIDLNSWVYLIIMLFVRHKNATLNIVKERKHLRLYFIEILSLWAGIDKAALKDLLDELLKEE
ncbi:MAG TPA: hypothetical protein DDX93_05055 [Smithella sp.]|jgi:hypothetical protein|nr:hypothetical protein [Smithella sp.]